MSNPPSPRRRGGKGSASSSPSRRRPDRYIPEPAGHGLGSNWPASPPRKRTQSASSGEANAGSDDDLGKHAYKALLRNELLGSNIASIKDPRVRGTTAESSTGILAGTRVLSYAGASAMSPPRERRSMVASAAQGSVFSTSPLSPASEKLLSSPQSSPRKISKVPFKVLDAPDLADDFYLNLLDWSSTNVVAVGLGASVYLWSAQSGQVTRLCTLDDRDAFCSLKWMGRGNLLALGTARGSVFVYDAVRCERVRTMDFHRFARVAALAWNENVLASGSRDQNIIEVDIRTNGRNRRLLSGHRQEVCGLAYSPDRQYLASGGNDNRVLIWSTSGPTKALHKLTDHRAAVKALAWSPHQHGLLASGGGTADQHIRFWNATTGQALQSKDTKSQVCNLAWSQSDNEIVSTHGYSQNQIILWKYPSMSKLAVLTGHTHRVLYLATSPDGQTIATGAGDETLRFWNVFNKQRQQRHSASVLSMYSQLR